MKGVRGESLRNTNIYKYIYTYTPTRGGWPSYPPYQPEIQLDTPPIAAIMPRVSSGMRHNPIPAAWHSRRHLPRHTTLATPSGLFDWRKLCKEN
jgi:hypothetical protein